MALRKTHSKSRHGCTPCKKRHIKCGEERPSCSNCVKSRKKCIYALSTTSESGPCSAITPASEASNSNGSPVTFIASQETDSSHICHCQPDAIYPSPTIAPRLQELRLMMHYTTSTYETVAHGETDIDIWRKVVPEEAVLHDFLMDGLLALSALHFASQNPNLQWQYTEIGIQYQSSGLQKYRYALERVTDDNSAALFAFSMIINVLALALPNVYPGSTTSSHAEGLMSMLDLVRGVGLMYHDNEMRNVASRRADFSGLFQSVYRNSQDFTLREDVVHALQKLRERADSIAEFVGSEQKRAYTAGISSLEEAFKRTCAARHIGSAIAWPATMDDNELLRLYKDNDPMAQFIFLHYGVLLLYGQDRWWGKDTGIKLVEHLSSALHDIDPAWMNWTQWARDIANSDFGR